ncbi:hypothetical protein, partial [Geobacillus sp. T6]
NKLKVVNNRRATNFMRKFDFSKFDLSLIAALLIVFPLGIYKIFFQKEHKLYSMIFGIFLIAICLYQVFEMLKRQK